MEDTVGQLALFCGMQVMVQENIAFSRNVVNGAEGIIRSIKYDQDENGRRYVVVVYVEISGAGKICPLLEENVVPIFSEVTTFEFPVEENGHLCERSVLRLQVPLLPAYAYTDYKSQGKMLECAIVDLESAQSLQGVYVMLS